MQTGELTNDIYRWILDALPVGVYMVDRAGRITFWNSGAERITGHLRQSVLGHLYTETLLVHVDESNSPLDWGALPIAETLREGRAVETRVSLSKRSGGYAPVHVSTFPLRDENGAVLGAVETFEALITIADWNRREHKLANYGCLDQMTGALSDLMVQAHLKAQLSMFEQFPVPFCIFCVSLDNLEPMRERYGQAASDAALRMLTEITENVLRPIDSLGRWEHNEFLAIVQECTADEAMGIGERLRKMVEHTRIPWWGDGLRMSVSVGVAEARRGDLVDVLVRRAEKILGECVKSGGNRVAACGPGDIE